MEAFLGVAALSWLGISIRLATPLLYAALGGVLAERVGVYNFALEGMMLAGAFFGYYGSLVTGNPWVGLCWALIAGGLTGLALAFTSVTLGVSQLVVGVGINIFYLGLTGYFYRLISGSGAAAVATLFGEMKLPILSDLPLVGEMFFQYTPMVYVAFLLVFLMHWFLQRTTIGLNLRAVGENPMAADSVGINVYRYRYLATIASGVLAAAGGAFLTLTQVTRFLENMIEGRGWIALAAVILGKYSPRGALAACLLFGAADALQISMQVLGVELPHQVLLMAPYILAMLALAGFVGRIRAPAAAGKPYFKG